MRPNTTIIATVAKEFIPNYKAISIDPKINRMMKNI